MEKVVLIAAQGYIDGIGPMSKGPRFIARLGAQILRTYYLRETASKMSYHDAQRFATRDATLIASLHVLADGAQHARAPCILCCVATSVFYSNLCLVSRE